MAAQDLVAATDGSNRAKGKPDYTEVDCYKEVNPVSFSGGYTVSCWCMFHLETNTHLNLISTQVKLYRYQ